MIIQFTRRWVQKYCFVIPMGVMLLAGVAQAATEPSQALQEPKPRYLSDKQIGDILFARANAVLRFNENGAPLVCQVGMDVQNIMQIDAARETYTVDFYVWISWNDARLAFDENEFGAGDIELPWDNVVKSDLFWNPELEFANTVDAKILAQNLKIESNGKCSIIFRQINTFRFGSGKRAFQQFPFDRQDLSITLESFRWDNNSLVFEFEEDQEEEDKKRINELEIVAWKIIDIRSLVTEKMYQGDPSSFSRATTVISIQRESGYYLWKICLPLFALVCIAIVAPWVSPNELSSRLAISLTTLVSLTAYSMVVNMELPKLSYLTQLDKWMLSGFLICGFSALGTVIVAFCAEKNYGFHTKLDYHSRWLLPLIHGGITLWWLSPK